MADTLRGQDGEHALFPVVVEHRRKQDNVTVQLHNMVALNVSAQTQRRRTVTLIIVLVCITQF